MFVLDFFLLSIGFGSLWWVIHDSDEVHRITAALMGAIAAVWIFCLMPTLLKIPVLMLLLVCFFIV